MIELLGIPPQALFGQLLLGLINGSFYAVLSLGLAVIFGMLNIINFAPANLATATPLVARFATVGNGIELVDSSAGGGTLQVAGSPTPGTAVDLGFIPEGNAISDAPSVSGGSQILTGRDVRPIEVPGVFLRATIDDDHFLDRRLEQGGVGGQDAGLVPPRDVVVLFLVVAEPANRSDDISYSP